MLVQRANDTRLCAHARTHTHTHMRLRTTGLKDAIILVHRSWLKSEEDLNRPGNTQKATDTRCVHTHGFLPEDCAGLKDAAGLVHIALLCGLDDELARDPERVEVKAAADQPPFHGLQSSVVVQVADLVVSSRGEDMSEYSRVEEAWSPWLVDRCRSCRCGCADSRLGGEPEHDSS